MSEQRKQLEGSTFEELYLQQRKKSQMLIIAVVVLAVAAAGSLAWGLSKPGGGQMGPGNFPQQGQDQGFGGQGGFGGPGGMRGGMGMDVTQFFNDDGSVDTSEVESFMSRMPSGRGNAGFNFIDRFKDMINQAADDGDITQDQADALIKAFEAESESNEA